MDYEKLEQLKRLHDNGALNDEEYEKEKKKVMDEDDTPAPEPSVVLPMGMSESAYLALMSFGMFIPYVGWILPIVLWIMGKENSILVNRQGKYILNWYITWFLFSIALTILFIIMLFSGIISFSSFINSGHTASPMDLLGGLMSGGGIFILLLLAVGGFLSLLFPIIGGIKGLNKQTWKYPLSIPFLN